MAVDPRDTDPADQDPRERGLRERSDAPALSLWVVIGGLLMLGVVVYVLCALF
jgi:type VI protein secretion system component VasF